MTELEKKLKAPFPEVDLEWRCLRAGKSPSGEWAQVFVYAQARAVQNRLDEVCRPENWKNRILISDKGVIQTLSIKIDDEWIGREDGADYTDFEAFKGGISGAFKRVASLWGIGRYLYDLEKAYVKPAEKGTHKAAYKDSSGKEYSFKWNPPKLPDRALPSKVAIEKKVDTERFDAGCALIEQMFEDNKAVLFPEYITNVRLDVEKAKTVADITAIYRELKTVIEKELKTKPKITEAEAKEARKKLAEEVPTEKDEMIDRIDGMEKGAVVIGKKPEVPVEQELDLY